MKQKPKRKKSVIVRLIVLGVSVYMVATLINLGNQLTEDRNTLTQLQNQRDTIKLENEELSALLDSDSHSAIIEKAARERLGYVYSDEEIYIDISGN
ncbi:MAG: septum formation initiator family protein [Acutalibacteraceae bacterium]|nr:septum formation initiator family protein [Acutalibacteraceae bacterium]